MFNKNLFLSILTVYLVTNLSILPPKIAISFTNFDEIIWFSTSDIRNIVSIFEFSFLFIPASWNSYSKSETALKPRIIAFSLYFLHNSIVRLSKEITLIFFYLILNPWKGNC